MDFEVEGARHRGGPNKTWSDNTEKECQTTQLYNEYAMDHRNGES